MPNNDVTIPLTHVEQCMRNLVLLHPGEAAKAAIEHLSAGGSRVRAAIAIHACKALAVPDAATTAVAAACELLHNASLVHDDLQDRSDQRRGRNAIWRTYGSAVAICAGDLLLSAAYAALGGTGKASTRLMMTMHSRVSEVIRGQCRDLSLRGDMVSSVEVYEKVAAEKSGSLLILPLELALTLAGRPEAIGLAQEVGALFAVGYQVADDIQDEKCDAMNKEMNIVALLAAQGHLDASGAARELAINRFRRCADLALRLPLGSGHLLAAQARQRLEAMRDKFISTDIVEVA